MEAPHTEPSQRTVPVSPMSTTTIDAGRTAPLRHSPLRDSMMNTVRWDLETIIYGLGVIDQAVLGLLELPRFRLQRDIPRSYFLEASQLHHGFSQNQELMGRLRMLAMGGALALRITKGWKQTMSHRPALTGQDRYKVISLAAASLLIPWLLLRSDKH
jgi:hypothetical protein